MNQAYGRGKEVRESQLWEQKGYYQPRCSKLHIHGQELRPFLQGAKGFHNLLKITPSSLFMLFRGSSIVAAYFKS
jgi:hypothetical protein